MHSYVLHGIAIAIHSDVMWILISDHFWVTGSFGSINVILVSNTVMLLWSKHCMQ